MCIRIKWKGRHDTLRMKPLGLTLGSGFLQAASFTNRFAPAALANLAGFSQ